jgi:SNF family Na+-dependent transporter
MKEFLELFNWKRRPATVWLVAGPIAIIGLFAMLARGILEIVNNGDWTYLLMNLAFLLIVGVMFIPAWKQYKIAMKRKAEYEERKRFYGVDE